MRKSLCSGSTVSLSLGSTLRKSLCLGSTVRMFLCLGREGGLRGLSGTFQIGASGMLLPKLKHILGCLAVSEFFFGKEKRPFTG